MNGIVIIKKYTDDCFFWPNLFKKNQIAELSISEIINKYQGFEGELISLFPIEESCIDLSEITNSFIDFTILYITSNGNEVPFCIKNQFVHVGYDFGVCEEDQSIYSSIFNEILFGSVEQLISWKQKLNDHFLFETRFLAKNYASLHHQLLLEGKDVEEDENMNIYEIWKWKQDNKP